MTQYKQTYATTRLGIGDSIAIGGAHPVTVSLDKEGGVYNGQVVFSEILDANVRQDSDWYSLTCVDTADVVDLAVPSTAKVIATRIFAITNEVSVPRRGALMEVVGENLLGLHQRRRHGSGRQDDFAMTPPMLIPPVPMPPGAPVLWYDGSDIATLWQDAGGTVPVVNDGDPVNRIDNKGSMSGVPVINNGASGDFVWFENFHNGRGSVQSTNTADVELVATTTAALQAGGDMSQLAVYSRPLGGVPSGTVRVAKTAAVGNANRNEMTQQFGDATLTWDNTTGGRLTGSAYGDNEKMACHGDVVGGTAAYGRVNILAAPVNYAVTLNTHPIGSTITILDSAFQAGNICRMGEWMLWEASGLRSAIIDFVLAKWALTYL